MEETAVLASLSALAQSVRLRIFRALIGAGAQGMTPGALSAALGVPGSTLSFHLKELTYAGLVSQEREGRNVVYRPSFEQMNALMAYLSARCCQSSGRETTASSGWSPFDPKDVNEVFPHSFR